MFPLIHVVRQESPNYDPRATYSPRARFGPRGPLIRPLENFNLKKDTIFNCSLTQNFANNTSESKHRHFRKSTKASDWVWKLAFAADITGHFKFPNLKLHGDKNPYILVLKPTFLDKI